MGREQRRPAEIIPQVGEHLSQLRLQTCGSFAKRTTGLEPATDSSRDRPIQAPLRTLVEDASPKNRRNRWHRSLANNLLKVWPALWTFTSIDC